MKKLDLPPAGLRFLALNGSLIHSKLLLLDFGNTLQAIERAEGQGNRNSGCRASY